MDPLLPSTSRSGVPATCRKLHPDILDEARNVGILVGLIVLSTTAFALWYCQSLPWLFGINIVIATVLTCWYLGVRYPWFRYLSWISQTVKPRPTRAMVRPLSAGESGFYACFEDQEINPKKYYLVLRFAGRLAIRTSGYVDAEVYCDPKNNEPAVVVVDNVTIFLCDSNFLPP